MRSRLVAGLVGGLAVVGTCAALFSTPAPQVIGGYSTSIEGRSTNQKHNAILALGKLNGVLIKPGETFSFNDHCGSFNRDSGFRRAPVSYNGQLIDSWGGGVCQASTTTYNAALLAGMTIVERHPHQFCPSYVPVGRDAAVSFGQVDLKFTNPYAFPVRLKAVVEGQRLIVQLLGTGKVPAIEVNQKVDQVTRAGELRLGAPSNSARQRNSGKAGFDVTVYRTINGNRVRVSQDSYPAMMRVLQYR